MKTYCQSCNHPNDLGHLFCVNCGARLVLENIGEEIETDRRVESTKGRFLVVLLVLAVVLVGLAVLALWPCKSFSREGGAAGNADAVEESLSRLQVVAEARRAPFTNEPLKEEDINAWLASACGRAGAQSVTVSLKPGRCALRVVSRAGPWTLFKGKKTIGPVAYSRDVSCGVTSNGLVVTGAKMGHLPMVGPLVKMMSDRASKNFNDFTRERLILSRITEAKMENGQISVVVTSPP